MSKPKRGTHRVSSPAATGGAGTFFEQHANATFLALLLVRGVPPICPSCRVVEVHLQTEHEGWNTDDFMVVGETGVGDRKRLVGQIKRSFAVSYSDDDFKGAILDAWHDFKSKTVFDVATDHFVIVTLLGSNTVLRYFTALLDCARASADGDEFNRRLATPGFVHSKVVTYSDEIRKILDEQEGRAVTFDELRDFLRLLYLLSFDLNTATAQQRPGSKRFWLTHRTNTIPSRQHQTHGTPCFRKLDLARRKRVCIAGTISPKYCANATRPSLPQTMLRFKHCVIKPILSWGEFGM